MQEPHPFALSGRCPCQIGEEAVRSAAEIYRAAKDLPPKWSAAA